MRMVRYNNSLAPSIFRTFFDDDFFAPQSNGERSVTWKPKVDVFEKDEILNLEVELPGVDKKDVKVSFQEGLLTISGERRHEAETEGETWHHRERIAGGFSRSFRLGDRYDAGAINATYKNGVLSLTIPKRKEALPVEVKIN